MVAVMTTLEQASSRVRPEMVLQPLVATLSLSLTVGSRLSSTRQEGVPLYGPTVVHPVAIAHPALGHPIAQAVDPAKQVVQPCQMEPNAGMDSKTRQKTNKKYHLQFSRNIQDK